MSEDLYSGTSEGFDFLVDGYIDYAKEVIVNRALPDVRDGFKPVGRRILEGMRRVCKGDRKYKSLTIVGEISKLHPHSGDAIYGALCSMTDKNGSSPVPIMLGQGYFSKPYTSAKPAAQRYTEVTLSKYAKYYLRDMEIAHMVTSEVGDDVEPEVIPVRFPAALTNGTSGLAVSVSTTIPSFNVIEVLKLTKEYLTRGSCGTILVPDFSTGGILVKDDTELMKIMLTGKGTLKIRAKVEIAGRDILVKEVPYGKTIEGVLKGIKGSEDLDGIANYRDSRDKDGGSLVTITCKNNRVVEETLMKLYQQRILQTTYPCNMLFTDKDIPVQLGVYSVISRWVEWRGSVCTEMFKNRLASLLVEMEKLDYFVKFLANQEWIDTFADLTLHTSRVRGRDYIMEVLEGIPKDIADWISKRSIPAFNTKDSNEYFDKYAEYNAEKELYEGYINNINTYVLEDIEDMLAEVENEETLQRKTLATTLDYRFSKMDNSEMVDDSPCTYTIYNTGFMTKTRDASEASTKDVLFSIDAYANSVLVGFDMYGRVLRVYGDDFPFTKYGDRGEYLYKYFGAEGFEGEYAIRYLCLLDNSTKMLVYKDGFVGYFDTSEFESKKKVRTIMNGVDPHVDSDLVDIIDVESLGRDPKYLVVVDNPKPNQIRMGVTDVSSIRVAGRKSRAKVFNGSDPQITHYAFMTYIELCKFVEDPMYFQGRMRSIKGKEVYGEYSDLIEARY